MVIFRRARFSISGFLIFGAIVMCIPGIIMLSISNTIYGKPILDTD